MIERRRDIQVAGDLESIFFLVGEHLAAIVRGALYRGTQGPWQHVFALRAADAGAGVGAWGRRTRAGAGVRSRDDRARLATRSTTTRGVRRW